MDYFFFCSSHSNEKKKRLKKKRRRSEAPPSLQMGAVGSGGTPSRDALGGTKVDESTKSGAGECSITVCAKSKT